jgi:hypothetical protein
MSGITPTTPLTPTTPTTPTSPTAPVAPGSPGVSGTPDGMTSMGAGDKGCFRTFLEKWASSKCCGCIARWLLNCFYKPQPGPTPIPVPPAPTPVEKKDQELRDEIIASFTGGAPNDTTLGEKLVKFGTISDLGVKLTVIEALQGHANSTDAHVAKFVGALSSDQKDQLRQLTYAEQTPADRAARDSMSILTTAPKCDEARRSVVAYKLKLRTDADNAKKELILNNFKDAYPTAVQRQVAAGIFKTLDNKMKLITIKGIMGSAYVTDVIIHEFVNLLPDAVRNDFFTRIQAKVQTLHEIAVEQQNIQYQEAVVAALTAVPQQPMPAAPAPLPAPATGQVYFTTNTRVDLVRETLDQLIAATA